MSPGPGEGKGRERERYIAAETQQNTTGNFRGRTVAILILWFGDHYIYIIII